MPSRTRIFFVSVLLALVATHATAEAIDEIFRTQDTNSDNALSVEEARTAAPAAFRAIDPDEKGFITADDIAVHTAAESGPDFVWPAEVLTAVAQHTLGLWDGDKDGKVTEQEYADAAVELMLLADTDGDRRVTREELQRFRSEAATP